MNQANKQLIKALPTEVFYLLTAQKAIDLTSDLIAYYSLDGIQAAALVELTESVYLKQIRLADLYTQVKTLFNWEDARLRKFVCDLAGFKLLPVSDWLGEDVANYIRSLGGNASEYLADVEELKKLAATELATDRLLSQPEPDLPPLEPDDGQPFNPYPDDPEYAKIINAPDPGPDYDDKDDEADEDLATEASTSPELLMEQYQDLLANSLSDLLEVDDNSFIAQFNYRLINLLVDHLDFKDRLISVLLSNNLQLGSESLLINGRQLPPTVGAWINYFISQKGSIMFDAVTLSDFLINAAGAKFLLADDKARLSRLLWLYRNLKFFPDSLAGDDPEHWEILTYVSQDGPLAASSSNASTVSKSATAVTTNPLTSRIEALNNLASQYPPASLERLAIEEEIKRLKGV